MCGKHLWFALLSFIFKFQGCITQDASCSRVDFDSATLSTLSRCGFYQEFVVKKYAPSFKFRPFRPNSEHYLSTQWEGLTCGETVQTFSLNSQSELRMVYSLRLNTGATLEVRVLDLDKLDSNFNPIVVIRWKTEQGTSNWGLFRERMNSFVRRAKIQIEANMNTGSDLAIEYFTIFNYEVETNECQAIDEFAPVSTTEAEIESFSTEEEPTTSTPPAETTSTHEISTTDKSVETSSHTSSSVETEGTPASTKAPSQAAIQSDSSMNWLWITLAVLFGSLLVLAGAGVIYIYVISKHLRSAHSYLNEENYESSPYKRTEQGQETSKY